MISQNAIFLFLFEESLASTFRKIAYKIILNYSLRKELAKIKLNNIEKVSKAHLQLEIKKLQMSLN